MKKLSLSLIFAFLMLVSCAHAQEAKGLLIDDFEGAITGGPEGTIDFGAGNGSSVKVTASTDIKNTGSQSIKVEYDAVSGGYIWIARGYGLDVKGAACWLVKPEAIDWTKYKAISFYMYGQNSKGTVAVDLKDAGGEMWRYIINDDFTGWKQIVCPFDQFAARTDWQPQTANGNGVLDFPVKSFQFEPLPPSKGVLYFDTVELVNK
jgi:beta-glucosidase